MEKRVLIVKIGSNLDEKISLSHPRRQQYKYTIGGLINEIAAC